MQTPLKIGLNIDNTSFEAKLLGLIVAFEKGSWYGFDLLIEIHLYFIFLAFILEINL